MVFRASCNAGSIAASPARRALFSTKNTAPSMLERHADRLGPLTAARIAQHLGIILGGGALALGSGVALLNNTMEQHDSFQLALDALAADDRSRTALGGATAVSSVGSSDDEQNASREWSVRKASGMLGLSFLNPVNGRVDYKGGRVNAEFDVVSTTGERGRCMYHAVSGAGLPSKWILSRLELQPVGGGAGSSTAAGTADATGRFAAGATGQDGQAIVVISSPSGAVGAAGAPATTPRGFVSSDGPSMYDSVATTGLAGLVIGSVAAVVVNSLMRKARPEPFKLALARMNRSTRIHQMLGPISPDHGLPPLKGDLGENFASFSFEVQGAKATGTAQVAAQRIDSGKWKLLQLRVRSGQLKVVLD